MLGLLGVVVSNWAGDPPHDRKGAGGLHHDAMRTGQWSALVGISRPITRLG